MTEPATRSEAQSDALHGMAAGDVIAMVLTVVWFVMVAGFFLFTNGPSASADTGSLAMTLAAVFLPVLLIWAAALTARTVRTLKSEAQDLRETIAAMRQQQVAQAQAQAAVLRSSPPPQAARTDTANPVFASRRESPHQPVVLTERMPPEMPLGAATAEEQPALALGTPAEDLASPLPLDDLVRALNFPESAADKDGFRALRAALEDRESARLVRAAQDVLTLLSQDGIYMDDLSPDRARPEIWRRFAQGERGRSIAALGGVRDRSSLALTAARMRQDTIFRDAAHHFLRQFDRLFAGIEPRATDQEIADLSDTRTARAFMLFGRVTGIFD